MQPGVVTYINQKFTREIRNCWRLLVSIGLTLQGIFLNFQEHFLCIYSRLVFKKLFFTVLQQQTASSLLKAFAINILLSEHKSSQIGQAANGIYSMGECHGCIGQIITTPLDTFEYPFIPLNTLVYPCLPLHTPVYSCIPLFALEYPCIPLTTPIYP